MTAEGDDGARPDTVRPVALPADMEGAVRRVLEEALPHNEALKLAPKVAPQLIQLTASLWQAPVPPPEILRQYDDVVPGSAKQIMQAFQDEGDHRRRMTRWGGHLQWFGLICGVLTVFAMLALAWHALNVHQPYVAGGIITALAGVAGVFVYRQRRGTPAKQPERPPQRPLTRGEQRNRRFGRT